MMSRFAVFRGSWLIAGMATALTIVMPVSIAAAQAQQPQSEGRVVVIGEGSVSAAPDYAEVYGGVTTHGKSVQEATDANSKLMTAITGALQDAGIAAKDIR